MIWFNIEKFEHKLKNGEVSVLNMFKGTTA